MDHLSKRPRKTPSIDVEYQGEEALQSSGEKWKIMRESKFEKRANSALEN